MFKKIKKIKAFSQTLKPENSKAVRCRKEKLPFSYLPS